MIRTYRKEDANSIIQIWLEASTISHYFIPYEYWESHADVMRYIYLPSAQTFIYLQNNQPQGFISITGNTIAALFVTPSQQRKGIGQELIDFAKKSYPRLELYVYCKNNNAIAFYQKNQFFIIDTVIDPGTGEKEYRMLFNNC